MRRFLTAVLFAAVLFSSHSAYALDASTFDHNLYYGIRNDGDVVELQNLLIDQGYLGSGNNTGYFGVMTQSAVQKYQAANGIDTTGYVGPITRGSFSQHISIPTHPTDPTVSMPVLPVKIVAGIDQPTYTILSKSVTKGFTSSQNGISTSTMSATFNVQVQTGTNDLTLSVNSQTQNSFVFNIIKDGQIVNPNVASAEAASVPQSIVVDGLRNLITIPKNTTVTIPVTFLFEGRVRTGQNVAYGNYAVELSQIASSAGTSVVGSRTDVQTLGEPGTSPTPITPTNGLPQINYITANPTLVTAGQITIVSWSTSNADTCFLTTGGGSTYQITPNILGSKIFTPTTTTTYVVSCTNSATGGRVPPFASQTVTVKSVTNTSSLPTVDLKVNGSDGPLNVPVGTPASISWSSTNATDCYADFTGPDGSTHLSPSGSVSGAVLNQGFTYSINCSGGGFSASDSVPVTLTTTGTQPLAATIDLKVNGSDGPLSIQNGTGITKEWKSTNAVACQQTSPLYSGILLNNSENTAIGPGHPYYPLPNSPVTFTISCQNVLGLSVSDSVTVSIAPVAGMQTSSDPYAAGYSQTSNIPLSSNEQKITYTYDSNACGTLMSYATPGSVSVGRGPVYALASAVCAVSGGQVPVDTSFRTYACMNVVRDPSNSVRAQATFAFQCTAPNQSAAVASSNVVLDLFTKYGLLPLNQ